MNEFLPGIFGLAATVIGLAVVALVIKNANGTSQVVQATSTGFATVISAATRG